jgi:2-dehydropantoate 2-reductase
MNAFESDILIAGTGAMACLFSSKLVAAGYAVTHLGTWTEGLNALEANGVRLVREDGSVSSYPVKVTRDPHTCKGANLVLVLVKSWQTARVALQLKDCLHLQGVALTLQNGLGNDRILAEALGFERVSLGITTTGSTLLGPGMVKPVGDGTIMLGDHPRLRPMIHMLSNAGFRVETVENTDSLIWGKLVVNSAINPLTALLRVSNGILLERPETRDLMARIAAETEAIAKAQKINLPYDNSVKFVESVALKTAGNNSSMLSDVLRGMPTEIDAINGAVASRGESLGIPTPLNWILWKLVKSMQINFSGELLTQEQNLVQVR